MNTDNKIPAFPIPPVFNSDGTGAIQGSEGLTMLDYFAAKAMQTILALKDGASVIDGNAKVSALPQDENYATVVAAASYKMAARMLEARKQYIL